jgi:uncharacterized protein (TIGR02680 family)
MTPASVTLPTPRRSRWQPLRVGLVDLFYYDKEEFWFRDGRLLLRGNNGTGKSKVLALTLPFLLDGDLRPHRVEPDRDPKKRMEWNLLLGGEHPHPERLGYAWIEFGRREPSGETEFRTLGCGLKAVAGRGIARHWFFVTDQRVGADGENGLSLLDATGAALARDRLSEALEGHGMVYDQARAYRRAVDEALFGLGEQRYAALVDLLVQLRQPQLSKRPDERALSRALTEALPPVDQRIVADVAEAFRSLDEEKDTLTAMDEARQAAGAFLTHYRRYARTAARRKARLPRERHSRYEHLQRDLSEARTLRDEARRQAEAARTLLAELHERVARLRAEDEALRASPEMRSARELNRAAEDATRTVEAARTASADHDRAAAQHSRAQERLEQADNRLAAAGERLAAALAEGREAAEASGVGAEYARRVAEPLAEADDGEAGVPAVRRAAGEIADRRTRAADHVEGLLDAAERAAAERLAATRRLEEADSELSSADERRAAAGEETDTAGTSLVAAVRAGLDTVRELPVTDPVGLLDRLQEWTGHLHGPSPARTEADTAHRQAAARLADDAAALRVERERSRKRLEAMAAELAALQEGRQHGPIPPHTRGEDARTRMPGAPLWRLVDFRDDAGTREAPDASERAGLEAALEASGLLDAWVGPDGRALAAGTHDVLAVADTPVAGPSLAGVLRPAVDHGDPRASAVGEEAVAAVLRAIGLGEQHAHTWVDGQGRFRVGALRGAWAKPAAEYLGEGAREEARRARIAALREETAAAEAALEEIARRLAELRERRGVLDGELSAVSGDESALRAAHARAAAAGEAVRRARGQRKGRAERAEAAQRAAAEAAEELRVTADELRLPAERAGLRAVREALSGYRAALGGLWPAVRERREAGNAVAEERAEAGRAAEHAAELAERSHQAAEEAAAADQRHATLRSTVGAAVAELQRRLGEVAETLREGDRERRAAEGRREEAVRAESRALGRIDQLEADLAEAARERGEAVAALRRFAATGLLAVALPELTPPPGIPPASLAPSGDLTPEGPGDPGDPGDDAAWSPTAAVELARAIERELEASDDSTAAWERVQGRLSQEFKSLQDKLARHGHSASGRLHDDSMVVDVLFQGRRRAVPELAEALAEEVEELQRMLSAREREILETHLLTEVGGTLQELIGAAERQVREMNEELADRPTSTGMRLRLTWRPGRNAPAGIGQARERLRQSADAWAPGDRAAIGAFLQERIADKRAEEPAGSWLEQLTAALDYRAWHEFGIERHQHGKWRSATGPASGGERVLSVSVPLFAAASSHYRTARHPHAPRLITLDEAFAGVDDDARAQCLGLLSSFDLDVVMTSEREWACYPEVPGIAIAQLSRVDGVPAVLVTRWEWDGQRRGRGHEPRAALPVTAVPEARAVTETSEALWS